MLPLQAVVAQQQKQPEKNLPVGKGEEGRGGEERGGEGRKGRKGGKGRGWDERGGKGRGGEDICTWDSDGTYRVILRIVKAGCHPVAIAQVVEH